MGALSVPQWPGCDGIPFECRWPFGSLSFVVGQQVYLLHSDEEPLEDLRLIRALDLIEVLWLTTEEEEAQEVTNTRYRNY